MTNFQEPKANFSTSIFSGHMNLPDNFLELAPTEQMRQLEDQYHELITCQRFYQAAVYAIDHITEIADPATVRFGLFLTGQWLQERSQSMMSNITSLKQRYRVENTSPTKKTKK